MGSTKRGTCIDVILAPDYLANVAELAARERISNAPMRTPRRPTGEPDSQRLGVITRKVWKPGRVLRVRFMDGDPIVQGKVIDAASEWMDYANLTFEVSTDPDAEIRITFDIEGYSSLIGIDSKGVSTDRKTMTLGGLTAKTDPDEYRRVVLHEFGHSIGCIHEHSSPAAGIPWDRPAVYALYAGEPNYWTPEQVDLNIFMKYDSEQTQFSAFDRDSIMLYPIDANMTNGQYQVGFNDELSDRDKQFIARIYPKAPSSVIDLLVDVAEVQGTIGANGEEDLYRFTVDKSGPFVIETTGYTDTVMALCGPDLITRAIADDDNSGLGKNAKIAETLIRGHYFVRIRHKWPTGVGAYSVSVKSAP